MNEINGFRNVRNSDLINNICEERNMYMYLMVGSRNYLSKGFNKSFGRCVVCRP